MNELAVQTIGKTNNSTFLSHVLVILNHSAPFGGLMRAELHHHFPKKILIPFQTPDKTVFLVACTRLYMPLCRLVGPSVRLSHFTFFSQSGL